MKALTWTNSKRNIWHMTGSKKNGGFSNLFISFYMKGSQIIFGTKVLSSLTDVFVWWLTKVTFSLRKTIRSRITKYTLNSKMSASNFILAVIFIEFKNGTLIFFVQIFVYMCLCYSNYIIFLFYFAC